jgi:hypothetical protein
MCVFVLIDGFFFSFGRFKPTLLTVPESVGFDVEIKYPESNAARKSLDYFDRNHVLDTVLRVPFLSLLQFHL